MIAPCEQIAASFGGLFECELVNGYVRIRTPFMYPDGDLIDLYLQEIGHTLTLTDQGETLHWLWMQQVAGKRTKKQEALIQSAAATAGVELFRGMLTIRLHSADDMAQAVATLGQAAVRISDIWFTFRSRSAETVVDDVAEFLEERRVQFEPDKKLIGRSGKPWRVDFQTRSEKQSSLVKVLSTGSRAAAAQVANTTVACWHDLSQLTTGPEGLRLVSLFDDTVDVWSAEDIQRVDNISDIAFWSRPDEFAERIAA